MPSGSTPIEIAAGATFAYNAGTVAPVRFAGLRGTLQLRLSGSTIYAPPSIAGFAPSDVIDLYFPASYTNYATSITFTPGSGGSGVLSLQGYGSASTVSLSGDYAGYTFLLIPAYGWLQRAAIVVAPTATAGVASAGTEAGARFVWAGSFQGAWTDAANWTVNGQATSVAPGANDIVTIATTAVVTGTGNAAQLALRGQDTLYGRFAVGSLTASNGYGATASILAGSVVEAGTVTVTNTILTVNGAGTRLSAAGALAVGGPTTDSNPVPTSLTITGGASVQAGSLSMTPTVLGQAQISIDATSSLELGTAGGARAGSFTVDAGASLVGSGIISAPVVVDNGVITAQGGTLGFANPVSGTGSLQIADGATLSFGNGWTAPVSFLGAGGVLGFFLGNPFVGYHDYRPGNEGVITGFDVGDIMSVGYFQNYFDSAVYAPGTNGIGTLTLRSSSGPQAVLRLAGDYADAIFAVAPIGGVMSSALGQAGSLLVTVQRPAQDAAPLFDAGYYLAHNPDVGAVGVDPYQHFLHYGWREGRDPSAAFSVRDYLAANPDVAASGVDPLLQYVQTGRAQGRAAFAVPAGPADPLVDAAGYYAKYADVKAAGADASEHYHDFGWREGRAPNAWFDAQFYLQQNPDVGAAGVDPLLHFEQFGAQEGRAPSLLFDEGKYLAANADVRDAGVEALAHYLTFGRAEGRMTFLSGGTAAADPLVVASYYDKQLGATLIPTGKAAAQQAAASYDTVGWQQGLNPNGWFDTNYYLAHNPDVAAAHVNPLLHYETYGWREGRDPSAQFSTNKYLAAHPDVKASGGDPLLHFVVYGQPAGWGYYPA